MGAAIDLMLHVGTAAIEARVLELARKARTMLCGLGADCRHGPQTTSEQGDRTRAETERVEDGGC
jgi:hypothetical protein